jgi:hypothetical protein
MSAITSDMAHDKPLHLKAALNQQTAGIPPRRSNPVPIRRTGLEYRQLVTGPNRLSLRETILANFRNAPPGAWLSHAVDSGPPDAKYPFNRRSTVLE